MLVDSHCHLDFPPFANELNDVVSRADLAGVRTLLTIGTELSRFPHVREIAESFENVWCTVGVHPNEADKEAFDAETLIKLADHPKVVGFGETGLDYFHDRVSRDDQIVAFRAHITAARETGLPLSIHSRDAIHDTVAVLTEEHKRGPFKAVLHCFSGSSALAEMGLDLGFLFSVAGVVTFPKTKVLKETLVDLPLDRLLVETDSPYLTPVPFRGQRNEPSYVAYTANEVASLKGVEAKTFREVSTDNFFRLFDKCSRPTTGE